MSNSNVDYVTLHYRSVLNDFSNQFINEEFSDCVLNAEGKCLKVHKAMLCAQSSFLEKMVLEHHAIGELCLTIDGILFEDLKSVVQFMYNGSAKVNRKNFGSFLVVAELLGVKWLDHIQILSDNDQLEITTNVPKPDDIPKSDKIETQPSVFKNITNILYSKISKRKKHMKGKKHCKKSRSDRCEKKKCSKLMHPTKIMENPKNDILPGKETHLAEMDENTFCTALGLKKNQSQPRDLCAKSEGTIAKADAIKTAKSKSVPPLIKINRDVKSNAENFESRDSNLYVSEINTVFIEDKNLSFLNIGANELCIRENNIEIECDVLDASSQYVIEKEATGDIVEIREENIIQAEFLDITPEKEPYSEIRESSEAPRINVDVIEITDTGASASASKKKEPTVICNGIIGDELIPPSSENENSSVQPSTNKQSDDNCINVSTNTQSNNDCVEVPTNTESDDDCIEVPTNTQSDDDCIEVPVDSAQVNEYRKIAFMQSMRKLRQIEYNRIFRNNLSPQAFRHLRSKFSSSLYELKMQRNLRKLSPHVRKENVKASNTIVLRKMSKACEERSEKVKSCDTIANNAEDGLQETLNKKFNLRPFSITLTKYNAEKEKKESEKASFLSNFNLQRKVASQLKDSPFIRGFRKRNCPRRFVKSRRFSCRNSSNFARLRPVTIQLEKLRESDVAKIRNDHCYAHSRKVIRRTERRVSNRKRGRRGSKEFDKLF